MGGGTWARSFQAQHQSNTKIIREATLDDLPAIARVHVDPWSDAYRGIFPDSFLDSQSYDKREARWREVLGDPETHSFGYVAEDERGEVVGFAIGGPPKHDEPNYGGEIYALHVRKQVRRHGLGRRFMGTVAERLAGEGISSTMLWVITENWPARRFYESLGGEYLYSREFELGCEVNGEVAYGWKDTGSLRSQTK